MVQNLAVVALLVVVLWALVLFLFLSLARRQNDIRAEMSRLDEELAALEDEQGSSS